MGLKTVGAALIVSACGGAGWAVAAAHMAEERCLMRSIQALELMRCELEFRVMPLPILCRIVAQRCTGPVGQLFSNLAAALEDQVAPDATVCMTQALAATPGLPPGSRKAMEQLGVSLGRFDLTGQLKGIEAVIAQCQVGLERFRVDMDGRLRSYRTLGLCAGCALAILLF